MENQRIKTPNKPNKFDNLLATFQVPPTFRQPTINKSINKTEANFQQSTASTYHHSTVGHQPSPTISQQELPSSNFMDDLSDSDDSMVLKPDQLEKLGE